MATTAFAAPPSARFAPLAPLAPFPPFAALAAGAAGAAAVGAARATAAAAAATAAAMPAPQERPDWSALVAERASLVRFARRRLLDPSLAEDLVHDVFEAVVCGRARFDGRASLRTWLTAVLKHKIVDLVRSRQGHESLDARSGWGAGADAEPAPELECPQPRPDEVAEQRQRLARALARIEALPVTLRHAFERRVLADQDSADVCRELGISENNLFVRLHRARAHLLAA